MVWEIPKSSSEDMLAQICGCVQNLSFDEQTYIFQMIQDYLALKEKMMI